VQLKSSGVPLHNRSPPWRFVPRLLHYVLGAGWRREKFELKRTMAALVFGNSAYPDDEDLDNPTNDATDLGAKLKSYLSLITAANVATKSP
jgi:hypothetical protein